MFTPNYEAWWNKPDLTESDLAWLMLGVNPDDVEYERRLNEKGDLSHEERLWLGNFGGYVRDLPKGVFCIGESHQFLMNLKLWGGGKESFIINAYEWAQDFLDGFSTYLKSIGAMPDYFDEYKNHDIYLDTLAAWDFADIDSEMKALALLMGFKPHYFMAFIDLHTQQMQKTGQPAFFTFPADRKFFFHQYHQFLKRKFEDPFGHVFVTGPFNSVRRLDLWTGEFRSYVQALHDAGVVFRPEIYELLRDKGIELKYSKDAWALAFYRKWMNRGVWALKEAAALYLGDDPHGGREFIPLANVTMRWGPGFLLVDKETIYPLDENGKLEDVPNEDILEDLSLDNFVRKHIAAGNIKQASAEGLGDELHFRPLDIVAFFRRYLTLTPDPCALLVVLGVEDGLEDEAEPAVRTGLPGRPAASKHLLEQEFERRMKDGLLADSLAEEVRQLREWLKREHPKMPVPAQGTTENNFRARFRNYESLKVTD